MIAKVAFTTKGFGGSPVIFAPRRQAISKMETLRFLVRHPARTLFTISGAASGIAILVVLFGLSTGMRCQIEEVMQEYNVDVTVQAREAATPFASRISREEFQRLQKRFGFDRVSGAVIGPVRTAEVPYLIVIGLSSMKDVAARVGMLEGEIAGTGSGNIMAGERLAEKLNVTVGDKIFLSGLRPFMVTGIYRSGSRILDGAVILHLEDALEILNRKDDLNIAFIKAGPHQDETAIVEEISTEFPSLSAARSGEFTHDLQLLKIIDAFAWAISMVALAASILVVTNTLFMSVTERTREFGILSAIGWSPFMIIRKIGQEAIIISILACILGDILALGGLFAMERLSPAGVDSLITPGQLPKALIASLFMAFPVAMASSILPALRAVRLSPAEALLHE